MNWTRGFKLAGLHVVIAVFLIACEEIPRWQTEKVHSEISRSRIVLVALQEEQTLSFSPCDVWRTFSFSEKVLTASELPVLIVSGWNEACPPSWTIAGLVGIDARHHSLRQRFAVDLGICALIAIQWILLGALPLVKPRRWWLEPGAANTALTCAVVTAILLSEWIASRPFSHAEIVAGVLGLPAALALLLIFSTWLALLSLITWRLGRFGWHAALSSLRWARAR